MKKWFLCLFLFFTHLLQGQNLDYATRIKPQADGVNAIGYIHVPRDRPIDAAMYLKVKYSLKHFADEKVPFVLLHLDTPGGEVFSSMKISRLLRDFDAKYNIPVVALIDDWAISAGALLAYSCRYIVSIETKSAMGAAQPVMSGGGKMEPASEKITSALRTEFANVASFYGRNPLLAEAMVDKDAEIVIRSGKIIKVETGEKVRSSDKMISAKGKLLTLSGEELRNYGVSDITIQPNQNHVSPLFEAPFFNQIAQPKLIAYDNWKVQFYLFLSHPIVAGLLMMGLIVGGYIEINTPGFGIPGTISLVSFFFVLLSASAVYSVNWIEVIILVVGFVLLALELLVIPGFGVAGVAGIALVLLGLLALLTPSLGGFTESFEADKIALFGRMILHRLTILVSSLLASIGVIVYIARKISMKPHFLGHLVLHGEQRIEEGYHAGVEGGAGLVGKQGVLTTKSYPSGTAKIEGAYYDVQIKGDPPQKGDPIEVIGHEGAHLIVKIITKKR